MDGPIPRELEPGTWRARCGSSPPSCSCLTGPRSSSRPPLPRSATRVELLSLPGLAGVLETAGGTLLLVGLFTRPVAFLLAGEMAVAYFMAHASRGFWPLLNGGEPAVLFCFIWLFLAAGGRPRQPRRVAGASPRGADGAPARRRPVARGRGQAAGRGPAAGTVRPRAEEGQRHPLRRGSDSGGRVARLQRGHACLERV